MPFLITSTCEKIQHFFPVCQKIRELTFDGGTENFTISLTYGLVEYDYHSDITTLLKEADEKLYVGKEGGRDRIIF